MEKNPQNTKRNKRKLENWLPLIPLWLFIVSIWKNALDLFVLYSNVTLVFLGAIITVFFAIISFLYLRKLK